MKVVLGLVLGLVIGAGCRWFDIPVPSPPKLVGALLVVAMTVGYMGTDRIITSRFSAKGPATTQQFCGGPTGTTLPQTRYPGDTARGTSDRRRTGIPEDMSSLQTILPKSGADSPREMTNRQASGPQNPTGKLQKRNEEPDQ